MGGAQIDRFGNLNSSFIGDADNPKIRLPGTGGGNDISSLTNMIVAMKHEKRRFVADVDFITSPGWIKGGASRAERGLPQGGMWRVVTDLAILGFDEDTREMKVLALQPGRHARAGAGQHRLRAAVRRQGRDGRAAAQGRARRPARARPRAALYGVTLAAPHSLRRGEARGEGQPQTSAQVPAPHPTLSPQAGRGRLVRGADHGQEEADRVRHRHAQLHQVPGDAERAGADRLRRAHGGAGLRVALGLGPHPARASSPTSRSTRR